jgi:hypothetical protein
VFVCELQSDHNIGQNLEMNEKLKVIWMTKDEFLSQSTSEIEPYWIQKAFGLDTVWN